MACVNNCAVVKLQSDAYKYNKEHTTLAILVVHSFVFFSHLFFIPVKEAISLSLSVRYQHQPIVDLDDALIKGYC